jgi:hypothetical protein
MCHVQSMFKKGMNELLKFSFFSEPPTLSLLVRSCVVGAKGTLTQLPDRSSKFQIQYSKDENDYGFNFQNMIGNGLSRLRLSLNSIHAFLHCLTHLQGT